MFYRYFISGAVSKDSYSQNIMVWACTCLTDSRSAGKM